MDITTLIVILVVAVILFLIIKPYFIKHDTICFFTGGLGAGKSFMTAETAVVLIRKQRFKVWIHNKIKAPAFKWFHIILGTFLHVLRRILIAPVRFFCRIFLPARMPARRSVVIDRFLHDREEIWPKPMMYSSTPLRAGWKEYCIILTEKHLLLQARIIPRSVVVLDELDGFCNQFEFDGLNVIRKAVKGKEIDWDKEGAAFDEYMRLFRHYTKGGYLVCNTQCSENAVVQIRRRINTALNLFYFRTWGIPIIAPHLIYTVWCRNISISEEIKTVEEANKEDNMRLIIGIMPPYRRYDTYTYSERYKTVPYQEEHRWTSLKSNRLLRCPSDLQPKYTNGADPQNYFDTVQVDWGDEFGIVIFDPVDLLTHVYDDRP